MPRALRVYLLGCIAVAFLYLLAHSREPLRLNLGDPSSDARILTAIDYVHHDGFRVPSTDPADSFHPIAYPPLPAIVYCAISEIGISDIGNLRIFALAFSALAIVLLYSYARRIWSETVVVVAVALFATSLMWMMFADSIHQFPLAQASAFLALWGLVRAIETNQRRHLAAAAFGSLACYLASYDYWLVLPAAVLFTVHTKLGDPFARKHRRFVLTCLAGCAIGALAKLLFASGAAGWHEVVDRKAGDALPTLIRRFSLMFTPLFWVTVGYTAWRAIRAASLRAALEDGLTWLLIVGLVTVFVSPDRAGHAVVSGALLPFYAIGSALLIDRLLAADRTRRSLAIAWLVVAPLWSFYVMLSHSRSVLDRDDVAKVTDYFAANDGNDFVISNLVSDGPIMATFGRRTVPAPDSKVEDAFLEMLGLLEAGGTDYVHVVMFTTPDSRAIESSMWPLAVKRHIWSTTGWPDLARRKLHGVVAEYDKKLLAHLDAVHAKRVMRLSNFDIYRVDRTEMLEAAGKAVPVVHEIDFASLASTKFKLLGWGDPRLTDDGVAVSRLDGFAPCPNPAPPAFAGSPRGNACETTATRTTVKYVDGARGDRAQIMIRVDRACDLRLTLELAGPALLRLSMNDFTSPECAPAKQMSVVVPEKSVHPGINIVTMTNLSLKKELKPNVSSLAIEPVCGSVP